MTLRAISRWPPLVERVGVELNSHRARRRLLGLSLATAVGVAAGWAGCGRATGPAARTPEPVRLGLARDVTSALVIVAQERGFFAAEGLELAVVGFVSGARALSALLTGQVDVATVAEVPVVAEGLQRQDFAVFVSYGSAANFHRVVARRSAGIERPADLQGRRVATQRLSALHFFLHLFLAQQRLSDRDVQVSFLKTEELVPALVAGRVDAIAVREPQTSEARAALGPGVVVFAEPGLYVRSDHLVGSRAFLDQRPEAVRRLVRGMLRAERYARERSEDSIALVAAKLGVDRLRVAAIWGAMEFRVALDQSLLTQLEDEARWMISAGLVPATQAPNFLRLIDLRGLEAVQPEAVSIIH